MCNFSVYPAGQAPWISAIRELPASEGEFCGDMFASVLECSEAEGLSCEGEINSALTDQGIGYCVKTREPVLVPGNDIVCVS